ncbi:MAG: biotin--[acetyl-CoA-carboxylase] ligase [Prolixibacteraceae bacterium]
MLFSTIGHTIIHIDRTESTNNYAISEVAVNEVQDGAVFLTCRQTAGRGQRDNRWESEDGKNLTFSIFLRPSFLEAHRQFMLSKMVCLGLVSFLSRHTENVKIKWPNDIYVGARKVCGILIENAIMGNTISQSVIGIGLNINQTSFLSPAPNPVSLKMITGMEYDLEVSLRELLSAIDLWYVRLREGRYRELDDAFYENLYRLNEWHRFRDEAHEYTGMITGVNAIGQLCIREKDGAQHEYHFKEVEYLLTGKSTI